MKTITLTTQNISFLKRIQGLLSLKKPLSAKEMTFLNKFLCQISVNQEVILDRTFIDECLKVSVWDINHLERILEKWKKLFNNIPGYDFAPNCYLLKHNTSELTRKQVIMVAAFAPSLSYNSIITNEAYEIHLKEDGTGYFWFPTFEDAKKYPHLFNFNGSWKEAYLLLIETLKQGWPMEEFPKELQQFLKK